MSNVNSTVTPEVEQIVEGAGKIKLDGVDLGSFRDGVSISYSEQLQFTRSDYALGEIDGEVMSSELTINTVLEQATLRNICIGMGGNTSSSSSSSSSKRWEFGPEVSITPKQLIITGMAPADVDPNAKSKARRITFDRVVRIGQTGISFRRGTETLVPVQFKALLNNSNKYFTLEEPIPLADL